MTVFWFFHTKKYKKSNFNLKKIKKIQPPKMNTVYFKGHVHLLRKCSGYISGKQCWKYSEVKMYSRYMKCLKLYPQIFSRLFPKKRGWGAKNWDRALKNWASLSYSRYCGLNGQFDLWQGSVDIRRVDIDFQQLVKIVL